MSTHRSEELPRPLKKFFMGEPLALGMVQIFTGILGIAFGIVINLAHDSNVYITVITLYWTGVMYIISGSLCVAAARNPKPSLVKGMLGMNIVSAVAAGTGIIFLSVSLQELTYFTYRTDYRCRESQDHEVHSSCYQTRIFEKILFGMEVVLLLYTILEFCISISSAAFGCKTLCRDAYTETVVIVYQNQIPENPVGPQSADKDPESP